MRTEGSILINRPIEQVFQLTNDNVADWSRIVVEDHLVEQKVGGVGSTFHTVTEDRGKRMEFAGVITQHDPPHLNAAEMKGKMFDINFKYTFAEEDGQTRVTQVSEVKGKGIYRLMFLLMAPLMGKSSCNELQKELESLKRFCEQDAAVRS